jgi:hypothetical protein
MFHTVIDIEAISSLAKSYMGREHTTILAVLSAANDIANQVVVALVKKSIKKEFGQ